MHYVCSQNGMSTNSISMVDVCDNLSSIQYLLSSGCDFHLGKLTSLSAMLGDLTNLDPIPLVIVQG